MISLLMRPQPSLSTSNIETKGPCVRVWRGWRRRGCAEGEPIKAVRRQLWGGAGQVLTHASGKKHNRPLETVPGCGRRGVQAGQRVGDRSQHSGVTCLSKVWLACHGRTEPSEARGQGCLSASPLGAEGPLHSRTHLGPAFSTCQSSRHLIPLCFCTRPQGHS